MTMKFWAAILLLAAAGCSTAPRAAAPAPVERSEEARRMVESLRVETSWRPPATGGDCVACWYSLPDGSYIAQGWPCWRSCGWSRPVRWSRACRPIAHCPEW